MSRPSLYLLFHGRFPSEKAAALFARLSAKSYAKHVDVILLLPRRLFRGKPEQLPEGVRAVYLPTLDLFQVPLLKRVAFPVSNFVFSFFCLVYLFVCIKPADSIDTNEAMPALFASLLTRNIIFEVHDFPVRFKKLYSILFKRVRYVLSTNNWKKDELIKRFSLSPEKIIVERNGVDLGEFASIDKHEARSQLNLAGGKPIAVYTGHLYGWKGVETLAEAALLMPEVSFYIVGGAPQDVTRFKERYSASNIHAVGYRPHIEVPLWQSAADVLVLPNTGEEEISLHYTSPMKMFEYMASERPIVASNVPSIAEVLNDKNAYLVDPDNAQDLSKSIAKALSEKDVSNAKARNAVADVGVHSWEQRANRIFEKMKDAQPPVRETFRTITVWTAYVLILGIAFFPFLFGNQIFSGGDVTVYYYGAFDFYHKALISGQSFLWNPLLFSGFPMYLSQVAGYFDPINYIIFNFFGGYVGVNIRLFLDYVLVAGVSYYCGRAWGLSRIASFCIGPAYILAFIGTVTTNPLFANSAFLMPMLMWVFAKIRTQGGFAWKASLLGGVAVGLSFLGGYAQIVVIYLTLFGVFGLLYSLIVIENGKLLFLARFIGTCAVVSSLGVVIGAPQIVPSLQFTPLTRRGGGIDYSLASLKAVLPGDVLLFIFPEYLYFPYVSVGRRSLYVGAAWFLLALCFIRVGIQMLLQKNKEIRESLIFAAVFILAFVTAITHSPIFYAMQHLPVFNLFRFSDRWMYGGVFFLAMLGGFGLDAIPRIKEKYLKRWFAIVTAPIAFFLLIIVFLNLLTPTLREKVASIWLVLFSHTVYGHGPFTKDIAHYREATIRGVEAWQQFTSFTDPSFLWPTGILVTGLVLIWLILKEKISTRSFRISILALSMVSLVSLTWFPFQDRLSQGDVQTLNENSFIRFVSASDKMNYRYYPVFIADAYQKVVPPTYQLTNEQIRGSVELAFSTGWPNTNFVYEMPTLDGYDVFITTKYIDALAKAGSTFGAQDYTRSVPLQEKIQRFNAYVGVIGMMGGKYIVSGVELTNPHLTLAGTYITSHLQIPIYVYINDLALPTAYIAKKTADAPGKTLANLMDDGPINFTRTTYLDCSNCSVSGDATLVSYTLTNGHAVAHVSAKKISWFVLSQSNLPGWSATMDGANTTIVTVNGLYMGVEVAPGDHTIEFVYSGMPL